LKPDAVFFTLKPQPINMEGKQQGEHESKKIQLFLFPAVPASD
jgi:hypothetical protein